jgi:Cu(I)/Ag(I) efflux system membrane fusion protein
MNSIVKFILIALPAAMAGIALERLLLSGPMTMDESKLAEEKPLYWVAPMDANYRRDEPGKSPMGMNLVPVYASDAAEEGTVAISARVQNNLGMRIGEASRVPMSETVTTVGFVDFDEDMIHHLHSRVEGWIGSLSVTSAGDRVSKGQMLFGLYSPELVNAQEEFLTAVRSGNSGFEQAARRKLVSLDVSAEQIESLSERGEALQYLPFHADRSGYVSELNVRHGMFVKPENKILSVGSLDAIWVIAEVFERQAYWIKEGQHVEMYADAYPGRTWIGSVDYIYPVLEQDTRTLRVRIRVSNEDESLKPNMLVRVSIDAGLDSDVLSIPVEALIRTGEMERVVKVISEEMFRSVRVTSGREFSDRVEILVGLSEGDRVVTSAQFLVDSESSLDADLSRIEGVDESASGESP